MRRVLCLILGFLATSGRDAGADTPPALGYTVERWSVDDGLPINAVTGVIQTRTGYLWVSTWAGIARFDGVRFTPVAKDLPNDHSRALVEDADGGMWIALSGTGVARWRSGSIDVVTPAQGLAGADVRALALDEDRLWVATENGVSAIDSRRIATWRARDGLPGNAITNLARGPHGGVWIAAQGGLCHATRLQLACRRYASDFTPHVVIESRNGRLWVGTDRGLLSGEAALSAPLSCQRDCYPQRAVTALMEARDGGLWIGFRDGQLVHRRNGVDTHYGAADGLPASGMVVGFTEDEESGIWAAISNVGLVRLRPKRVRMFTAGDGLPREGIGSIVQDVSGTIWVAAPCGPLSAFLNGRFHPRFVGQLSGACPVVLWPARDGSLWIGTRNRGLFRWRRGRMDHLGAEDGLSDLNVTALFEDRDGAMWIGTAAGGLHVYRDGALSRGYGPEDGVATGLLVSFAQDRDGRVWIGSNANGLSVYEHARFRRLGEREQPPSRSIAGLLIDSRGDLWIGTASHGLFRRRRERYEPFGVAQGLNHELVALMLEDRDGTLWVSTGRGIARLTRDRIEDVATGRRASLDPVIVGRGDGLRSVEGSGGGFDPSGLRDRDGRLWFSTTDGIAIVDPAALPLNTVAPRVIVERVSLGGRPAVPNGEGSVDVPAGTAAIDIAYTAFSFRSPRDVRFRVRLRGVDDDWQDVGGRRTAYYTRLPPGAYTFEALAANEDGLWSPRPAAMRLVVAPFWWERRLVQWAGAVLLFGLMAVGVRHVSLRRARARLAELERARALDRERGRIARDLHDDLGSRLAHIAILAETSRSIDGVSRVVQAARDAAQTMDELVWAISARNDTVESFAYYLGRFAEEHVGAAGLRCRLDIPADLPDRPLPAEVRRHLYLASKEAVTNAVKHARATEVGVTLCLRDGALTLEVSDDGCGLPPEVIAAAAGNGLKNLRERMTAAGGVLDVESSSGAGTRIRCRVPASVA